MACFAFTSSTSSADTLYISKNIGKNNAKLPILPNFSAACEESPELLQFLSRTAPKNATLITCFVDSKIWQEIKAGKELQTYPLLTVSVLKLSSDSDVTPAEFKTLKETTDARLREIADDYSKGTEHRLAEQDASLAKDGTDIKDIEIKGFETCTKVNAGTGKDCIRFN